MRFALSSVLGVGVRTHTGAATLALRTEFYRQRIMDMATCNPSEAQRLADRFNLQSVDSMSQNPTRIVPVNLTYYPLRAKDNALSRLAERVVEDLPERVAEEIMTEGAMLLSGVDIDMRFGKPIEITTGLSCDAIQCDIRSSSPIGFDDLIPSRKFMRREALKITQQYMSAIYRMTTVNHDHLFASCLKKSPVRHINNDNLRRRVFLASQHESDTGSVYFHNNFEKDQVHLLTDDRYHRFNEFVDFAITALGYDPGEPYNTEHVRVKLLEGGTEALVSYRNRVQEVHVPEIDSLPTWKLDEEWIPS